MSSCSIANIDEYYKIFYKQKIIVDNSKLSVCSSKKNLMKHIRANIKWNPKSFIKSLS